jgi:6,7-dimethyl-8-ribityllumazine synthase
MREHQTNTASAHSMRIAVITSIYHDTITTPLRLGAIEAFDAAGGRHDDLIHVESPGAWELAVIAAVALARDDIDAVVALGCVITGETMHDTWINTGLATALAGLSTRTGKPVAFGVLTCATRAQALARAGGDHGNKGHDAMCATIEAVHAIGQLSTRTPIS